MTDEREVTGVCVDIPTIIQNEKVKRALTIEIIAERFLEADRKLYQQAWDEAHNDGTGQLGPVPLRIVSNDKKTR